MQVQYKLGEDLKLDFHYDESEVTLNVCLGKEFVGIVKNKQKAKTKNKKTKKKQKSKTQNKTKQKQHKQEL